MRNDLTAFLASVSTERCALNSAEFASTAYELAKTRLARLMVDIEPDLRQLLQLLQDQQDAARSLDIDPPEPGSPLARAFAANAALRKERDAAYAKGAADAKMQFAKDVRALQDKLRLGYYPAESS